MGISLITVGAILRSSTGKYLPIFKEYPNYTTAPDLIIFLGVIVFFIAFFGCCGALRENHCMIFTVSVGFLNEELSKTLLKKDAFPVTRTKEFLRFKTY